MLQKLGFGKRTNVSLLERAGHASNVHRRVLEVDFTFFELHPNISPEFQSFIRQDLFNRGHIDMMPDTPIATAYDYHQNCHKQFGNMIIEPCNGRKSIDEVIWDALSQLPESLLDEICSDIDQYCDKDDFSSLAHLLHWKKLEYKRKGIKVYNYDIVELGVDMYGIVRSNCFAKLLKEANGFAKDARVHTPQFTNYFFNQLVHNCLEAYADYVNIPENVVVEGVLKDLMNAEINLGDPKDLLLSQKIMADRICSAFMLNQREKIVETMSSVISKHIDKIN